MGIQINGNTMLNGRVDSDKKINKIKFGNSLVWEYKAPEYLYILENTSTNPLCKKSLINGSEISRTTYSVTGGNSVEKISLSEDYIYVLGFSNGTQSNGSGMARLYRFDYDLNYIESWVTPSHQYPVDDRNWRIREFILIGTELFYIIYVLASGFSYSEVCKIDISSSTPTHSIISYSTSFYSEADFEGITADSSDYFYGIATSSLTEICKQNRVTNSRTRVNLNTTDRIYKIVLDETYIYILIGSRIEKRLKSDLSLVDTFIDSKNWVDVTSNYLYLNTTTFEIKRINKTTFETIDSQLITGNVMTGSKNYIASIAPDVVHVYLKSDFSLFNSISSNSVKDIKIGT